MKQNLLLILCLLFFQTTYAQVVGSDNAANYVSWLNASNSGSGFTGWDLWTQNTDASNFAGHFLGSSTPTHGDINTSGDAFGMYGNPTGNFAQANAQRGLNYNDGMGTYPNLQDGHTFSIDLAVAYRNGYKGIDIMEDDYTLAFNFNIENDLYKVNGVDLGWTYNQFSIITLEVTQLNATTILVRLTRGVDVYEPSAITVTNRIGWFKCYVGNTSDGSTENNLFFNNLEIRTDNPLPVELANFSGFWENGKVNLNWLTQSEQNNKGFEIERSTNGFDYETIGFVEGKGNSFEPILYHFMDENAENAINYYRLKQIDYDESFNYSDIIAVKIEEVFKVDFYPNPVKETLNITTDFQEEVRISIITLGGHTIFYETQIVDNQSTIDLSFLNKGIYYLVISNNESTILKKTFIKE